MIDKLNTHFSFNNPASIHDEEALTALELAGRQSAKINEVITDQNNLRIETETHLKNQDDDIKNRMDEQDADIENIRTKTVPADVKTEVQRQIDNGTFDRQIDESLNNLNERVDNLLGKVVEGSTTGDAELIDARVDCEGMTHENVGEHIRNMTRTPKFFDSDIIKTRYKSVIPQKYLQMEYNGTSLWKQFYSDSFTLEQGDYVLIVPDSNAVILSLYDESDPSLKRLVSTVDVIGMHSFTVTEEYADSKLCVAFNASGSTPNTAGTYYGSFYIYKLIKGVPILPDYVFDKTNIPLLQSDIVAMNHETVQLFKDITFEHNGTSAYHGIETDRFKLEAGDYYIIATKSNFIGMYIMYNDQSGEQKRILSYTDFENGVTGAYKFTVTEEQSQYDLHVRLNCSASNPNVAGTYYCDKLYILKDNGEPLLPEYLTNYKKLESMIQSVNGTKDGYLTVIADSVPSGTTLQIDKTVNVKKNKTLIFSAEFDSFSGLRVGHGKSSYGGNYVEVDNTNIKAFSYLTGSELITNMEHGLNLDRFITVIIKVDTTTADITLFTSTGMYTMENVPWSGCNGYVFAEPLDCTLGKTELKWTTTDITKPIWIFGDSYLGMSTPARYPYYLLSMGFDNWLCCGYPGGNSNAELSSLKNLLELGRPEIVVWCLGMNNGDDGAINPSWLYCVEEVKVLCENNNIELILATIPTCPEVDNTYKNEYVRNSGYRYVDFHRAVNRGGTSWVDGALHSDNVHPTELGAKILANRFIVDVPEITM